MTVLNLSDQRTAVQNALPAFQAFKTEMDKRKLVWDKLTPERRLRWVQSSNGTLADSKDPVMWLAINLKQYLDEWELDNA